MASWIIEPLALQRADRRLIIETPPATPDAAGCVVQAGADQKREKLVLTLVYVRRILNQ